MPEVPPWELLGGAAGERYDGEDVSQLQHALQAAALAKAAGASDALQLAALFHDVGHLVVAASRAGRDQAHARLGALYLQRWYADEVTGPVALHVEAKRWLARDPAYLATLSEESVRTLRLQGGPFRDGVADLFRARRHADEALALRRWDDLAKDPAAEVPGLEAWIPLATRLAAV